MLCSKMRRTVRSKQVQRKDCEVNAQIIQQNARQIFLALAFFCFFLHMLLTSNCQLNFYSILDFLPFLLGFSMCAFSSFWCVVLLLLPRSQIILMLFSSCSCCIYYVMNGGREFDRCKKRERKIEIERERGD